MRIPLDIELRRAKVQEQADRNTRRPELIHSASQGIEFLALSV